MRRAALLITLTAVALPAQAAGAPRAVRGAPADLDSAAAPSSQLRKVAERRAPGRRFLRYRQVVGGLPVLGSETVLTEAAGTRADLLLDGSRRIGRIPAPATVRRSRAVAVAVERAGGGPLRGRAAARLAILARGQRARAVWRVVVPAARPAAAYEVLVDARAARVLRLRDLAREGPAEARVFDPNPVVANGGRGLLSDGSPDSAFTTPVNLYEVDPLDSLDNPNCLSGDWVNATLPGPVDVCTTGADFTSFDRSDEEFEAAMSYFHIDRAQDYIQGLGITAANNRQTHVNVNDFLDDNSKYVPDAQGMGTGEIFFGTGGTDDAEDAEVIVHEYGHAIQDNQVPGFGDTAEGAAMGEGFSDYLASALSKKFAPSATHDACFAEWDQLGAEQPLDPHPDPPCLRRVDKDLTAAQVGPGTACDEDPTSGVDIEEHCAGEAWSGALWDVRAALDGAIAQGAAVADRKIIESHFSLTPQSDFHAGSLALVAAYEGDPSPAVRAQAPFVRSLLTQRGLLDVERLDDTPAAATDLGLPGTRTGQLQAGRDDDDVYSISLTAGRGVVLRLRPAGGQHDFDLRLLRPGTTALDQPGATVAVSETAGSSEDLAYTPGQSGTHFLDVRAFQGLGGYTVSALLDGDSDARPDGEDNCPAALNPGQEDSDGDRTGDACDRFPDDPANDVDRDGLGADEDNCPRVSNRRQIDWDADDRGDVCDRSARVSLRRLKTRRRKVTLRATLRPSLLGARSVTVRVERRRCPRCRFAKVTTVRRGRARGGGRVDLTVKLRRRGSYRFRATLSDRRYNRAKSRLVKLRLR